MDHTTMKKLVLEAPVLKHKLNLNKLEVFIFLSHTLISRL